MSEQKNKMTEDEQNELQSSRIRAIKRGEYFMYDPRKLSVEEIADDLMPKINALLGKKR